MEIVKSVANGTIVAALALASSSGATDALLTFSEAMGRRYGVPLWRFGESRSTGLLVAGGSRLAALQVLANIQAILQANKLRPAH